MKKNFFIIFVFSFFMFITDFLIIDALFENLNIYNVSISEKYIAIESDEIVDENKLHYIFLYDIENNKNIQIYSNNGEKINSSMFFPSISNDGRYLTFTSRANNVTGDFINKCVDISDGILKNCSNIYLYDIEKKESIIIKYNSENFNGDSYVSKISGNGSDIVFESISTNMIDNNYDCTSVKGVKNCINIYKYNINSKKVILVSTGKNNLGGDSNSINPSISDDGRFITYQSASSNILSSVENDKYCFNYVNNEEAVCSNVFFADTKNNSTIVLSHDGVKFFNDNSGNAIISGNGDFVVFESYSSNMSKVKNRHIYYCDIKKDECYIISKKINILNNRESFVDDISNDGKYVLYRTDSTNLDDNKGIDLYVYNALTNKFSLISNDDIILSSFGFNNVYYYNNEQLSFNKIDNQSPVIDENQTIYILKEELLNINDKIIVNDNLSNKEQILFHFEDIQQLMIAGKYFIEVKVSDEFNNIGTGYVNVIVLDSDNEAPVFNSVKEIKILKGTATLNLDNYIEAKDKVDGITKIYIVDDGELNLNVTGSYKIKVMSKDSSSNVVYKEIYIVVYENYSFDYFFGLIIVLGLIVVFIFSIIKVK